MASEVIVASLCLLFSVVSASFVNPGKLTFDTQGNRIVMITRAMYNGSTINIQVKCGNNGEKVSDVEIAWSLTSSHCAQEYSNLGSQDTKLDDYFLKPYKSDQLATKNSSQPTKIEECGIHSVVSIDGSNFYFQDPVLAKLKNAQMQDTDNAASQTSDKSKNKGEAQTKNEGDEAGELEEDAFHTTVTSVNENDNDDHDHDGNSNDIDDGATNSRKKRDTEEEAQSTNQPNEEVGNNAQTDKVKKEDGITTWKDGIYLLLVKVDGGNTENFTVTVDLDIRGPDGGYLDALNWPLLPFYGVMCGIYAIMALVWMLLLCCNWRDLLRIQFWIGGVILLGMLEKAMFLAEYESINQSGYSVRGAIIIAMLVSCMKRTLARMLVVIVSLGFGIVKPRLGPVLHRVLGMGALYFLLSAVEGIYRGRRDKNETSKTTMLPEIPLAVLDAAICWWIFTALVDTMRTLRLRRNLVKLSLYRHFTNTLIFAVLASVGYMIWSLVQHRFKDCITDWKELWVDDAFWHILFSVILIVIIVLWRPTANNQRYAFSPLLDQADEEAEEPMMNDAFDGMKMRPKANSDGKRKEVSGRGKSPEDDLKWIEENIPASVTDSALPSILDSDDEIMTTKFEMSKME